MPRTLFWAENLDDSTNVIGVDCFVGVLCVADVDVFCCFVMELFQAGLYLSCLLMSCHCFVAWVFLVLDN